MYLEPIRSFLWVKLFFNLNLITLFGVHNVNNVFNADNNTLIS